MNERKAIDILNNVRKELTNRLKELVEKHGGKVEFNVVWDKDEDNGKEDVYFAELPVEFYLSDHHAEPHYIYSVENNGDVLSYAGVPMNYDDYAFDWVETSAIAELIDLIEERLK